MQVRELVEGITPFPTLGLTLNESGIEKGPRGGISSIGFSSGVYFFGGWRRGLMVPPADGPQWRSLFKEELEAS